MNAMQNWFSQLQPRERTMVSIAGVVVLFTLLYLALWKPVFSSLNEQQAKLESQRNVLSWMRSAEQEVQGLKASGTVSSDRFSNSPISTIVERSTVTAGIRSNIAKMESSGKEDFKVQFKSVGFDRLMLWLGNLDKNYGVNTKHASINRAEEPGQVSARITLVKQK